MYVPELGKYIREQPEIPDDVFSAHDINENFIDRSLLNNKKQLKIYNFF